MKNVTTQQAPAFAPIDDQTLVHVHGGDSIDWVNVGGGVATGFCALGPLSKAAISGAKYVLSRGRLK